LTYSDDQVNMMVALLARSLNPAIRLVIRMYNHARGLHLEHLLDHALRAHSQDPQAVDISTTVLSDVEAAVPELVAAAAMVHAPRPQVVGKAFRVVAPPACTPPEPTDLATLAVLSGAHQDDPRSEDSAETTDSNGIQLLPDTVTAYRRQITHGRLMLEEVTQ